MVRDLQGQRPGHRSIKHVKFAERILLFVSLTQNEVVANIVVRNVQLREQKLE